MPCPLPADCLNEIFEYLDKITLHSCLMVNRLWCEVSVRILWRSIQNYNTLIACLPSESRNILYKNKIIISNLTSKHPLFNYIIFIKSLSIREINSIIKNILKNYQSITPLNLNCKKHIVAQEIYKLLMNQTSLRSLHFYSCEFINIPNIIFTSFPGANDCLKDLSKLSCRSDVYPEFFYQLSQICHNIQYLDIAFSKTVSNGITDLISVQHNLKYLDIIQYYDCEDYGNLFSSLSKLPNTLIKLDFNGYYLPSSFIANYTNLQELVLSFDYDDCLELFNEIQYSQLQILKIKYCSSAEFINKFLEKNGKNLKEFYVNNDDNSLSLTIIRFCPNLKILYTLVFDYELETLKQIFINCRSLESIMVTCDRKEKEMLKVVAEYSPKKFYELKLHYAFDAQPALLPEELESFLISWMNRTPQTSLSLFITGMNNNNKYALDRNEEIMKVIEKYFKLGVIKKFMS